MITLKEPIKLNTAQGLLTTSDAFNEKLTANYTVMQAWFMPEDLLHLLTGSEEQQEVPAGITSIAMSSSTTSNTSLKLDMINNVVNRILLSESADFSYQDTVYITSVLQKMGITDVSEFMKQVRAVTEESRNIYSLANLYQQNYRVMMRLAEEVRKRREREAGKGPAEELPEAEERYYLHNEIYNRLGTAQIYALMNSLHLNQAENYNRINFNEVRLSEHLRVSNLLRLSEYKHEIFDHEALTLINHVNSYETGDAYPPPQNEREVIERAASAALLTLIDNVSLSRLNRVSLTENVWLDIKNAISAAAENSLFRFEAYHSGQTIRSVYSPQYTERLNMAFGNEITELKNLAKFYSEYGGQKNFIDAAIENFGGNLILTHIDRSEYSDQQTDITESNITESISPVSESITELTRSILHREAAARPKAPAPSEPGTDREVISERSDMTHIYDRAVGTIELLERLSLAEEYITMLRQSSSTDRFSEETTKELYNTRIRSLLEKTVPGIQTERTDRETTAYESIQTDHIYTKTRPEEQEPVQMTIPVPPEGEVPAEVIENSLRLIDQKNREMLEKISTFTRETPARPSPAAPDKERIRNAALTALEHPESVISELTEQQTELTHIKREPLPGEIMQNVDEYTKTILETIERYRSDPAAAIGAGIVRPAGTEELNAEIRRAVQQSELELTHKTGERQTETQIIHDAIENVTERIREKTLPVIRESIAAERPGVRFVHRFPESRGEEEPTSYGEQRRSESVMTSTESKTVINEGLTETQINKISQDVITKAGEDITEIINKTLARQIGTISEKVFSQMEKKLQMERARRGRF